MDFNFLTALFIKMRANRMDSTPLTVPQKGANRLVYWLHKRRKIFKARRTFKRILSERIQANYVRQQNLFLTGSGISGR